MSESNVREAKQMLDRMEIDAPEITQAAKSKMAARTLLNNIRHDIRKMEHEGMLDHNEAESLVGSTENQMQRLSWSSTASSLTDVDVMQQLPWLMTMSVADRTAAIKKAVLDNASEGTPIMSVGEPADDLVVIVSGIAEVIVEMGRNKNQICVATLRRGQVIGEV